MIVELPIKAAFVFLIFAMCGGCAETQRYETVQTGPTARINFISPFLEDRFLSVDRLGLFVLEPNDHCVFTSKGSIPLAEGTKKAATSVPANRRIYLRIWQKNWEFQGASYERKADVSFVPEDGAEYTIEHIDTPNGFRTKYYKHEHDGKKAPIEIQSLHLCETYLMEASTSEAVKQYHGIVSFVATPFPLQLSAPASEKK